VQELAKLLDDGFKEIGAQIDTSNEQSGRFKKLCNEMDKGFGTSHELLNTISNDLKEIKVGPAAAPPPVVRACIYPCACFSWLRQPFGIPGMVLSPCLGGSWPPASRQACPRRTAVLLTPTLLPAATAAAAPPLPLLPHAARLLFFKAWGMVLGFLVCLAGIAVVAMKIMKM
jgi:hypothetical protein